MAKARRHEESRSRKPLAWLHGEVKSPPFTAEGRKEAGDLLRFLQEGESLTMPQAEALPTLGSRFGSLRIRDSGHSWRIVFRVDRDAVLILEVYAKKTPRIPREVLDRCRTRLRRYDEAQRREPGKG